jgi:hypothetical protein
LSASLDELDSELHQRFKRTYESTDDETGDERGGAFGGYSYSQKLYTTSNPWFLSLVLTLACVILTLMMLMVLFYDIVGRIWAISVFAAHFLVTSLTGMGILMLFSFGRPVDALFATYPRIVLSALTSMSSLWEIIMFGIVYPKYFKQLIETYFTECGGTTVPEYERYNSCFRAIIIVGYFIVSVRLVLGSLFWLSILLMPIKATARLEMHHWGFWVWPLDQISTIRRSAWIAFGVASLLASVYWGWSLYATLDYFFVLADPLLKAPGP